MLAFLVLLLLKATESKLPNPPPQLSFPYESEPHNQKNPMQQTAIYEQLVHRYVDSWAKLKYETQSFQAGMNTLQATNDEQATEIASLNKEIDSQAELIDDLQAKLRKVDQLAKDARFVNVMHDSDQSPWLLTEQKARDSEHGTGTKTNGTPKSTVSTHAGIMLVVSLVVLFVISTVLIIAYHVLHDHSTKSVKQDITPSSPSSDRLSSIIVMDDETPTNSTPVSPRIVAKESVLDLDENTTMDFIEQEVYLSELPESIIR